MRGKLFITLVAAAMVAAGAALVLMLLEAGDESDARLPTDYKASERDGALHDSLQSADMHGSNVGKAAAPARKQGEARGKATSVGADSEADAKAGAFLSPGLLSRLERGVRLEPSDMVEAAKGLRRMEAYIQEAAVKGLEVPAGTRRLYMELQRAYYERLLRNAPPSIGGDEAASRLKAYHHALQDLKDGQDPQSVARQRSLKRKMLRGGKAE